VTRHDAWLVLADGTTFEGFAAGFLPPLGVTAGEFVFNTSTSGYQEVITDPSYAGQIVTFTYPHIGNYGVTPLDDEATRPWCRGVVVRDLSELPSNWRSRESLETFLVRHEVPAIVGVDTRRASPPRQRRRREQTVVTSCTTSQRLSFISSARATFMWWRSITASKPRW
jgi:carbamoyl-phosphate synthase small subunit